MNAPESPENLTSADQDGQVLLNAFLQTHQVPCPVCGYGLHKLKSDRCPECGATLKLMLGRASTPMAAWLVMAVPMFVATGETLYMIFFTLQAFWTNELGTVLIWEWGLLAMLIPLTLGGITALIIRPWFVQWPQSTQWAIGLPLGLLTCSLLLMHYIVYLFAPI